MAKNTRFILTTLAIGLAGCLPDEGANGTLVPERPAIRTSIDLARGVRWDLDWNGVAARDLANGRTLRQIALPGATFSAARDSDAPDLLLARDGALIVSSNTQPTIWRVSPARYEVERFDIEVDADADKDFGFAALAWTENERAILARAEPGAALWRIDLVTFKATKPR